MVTFNLVTPYYGSPNLSCKRYYYFLCYILYTLQSVSDGHPYYGLAYIFLNYILICHSSLLKLYQM